MKRTWLKAMTILGLLGAAPLVLAISGPPRKGIIYGTTTIATTATQVSDEPTKSVCFKVAAGGSTVFLGGSDVTTATGFPIAAGEAFCDDLDMRDGELYGIVASGTQALNYLGSSR